MTRERGFTLIEVLIATAIIALVLGAFVSGGARYADYARYIRDRNIAQWVARDQMVEFQLADPWPDTGKQEDDVTMGGSRWRWVADIRTSPDPDVRRVDLRVYRYDPDRNKAEPNSVTVLNGFVTEHIRPQNAPAGADADHNDDDTNAVGDYGNGT